MNEELNRAERCGTCKHYNLKRDRRHALLDDQDLHPNDFEAECRRYPPQRFGADRDYYGSLDTEDVQRGCFDWPVVNVNAWCGEWRPASMVAPDGIRLLAMSQRTINALITEGFDSIEQVKNTPNRILAACPSIGVKTIREVRDAILNFDAGRGRRE